MFDVRAVKKTTVAEQIMEQIAELITTGKLKPGEKLPNERELAEKFQVTRSRVREALRALSLVGLIVIKPGEGSFVKENEVPLPAETITWMFHNEIHNLHEIYDARKLIESEIYLTAAQHASDGQIQRLEEILQSVAENKERLAPVDFLQLLDEFDRYMGDICQNRVYAKLMQTIIHLRRETSIKILSVPGAMEQSVKLRSGLLESMKTRDLKQVRESVNHFFHKSREFYDSILEKK